MSARPPSPEPPLEGENEVQRNIRLKVCAYCKAPGARLKCAACRQRTYCDKTCQEGDWEKEHRPNCKKLQQLFVPPPAGWRETKEEAERACGHGGGAAAVGCGGGVAVDDDDEFVHVCPICMDNEDDAVIDGQDCVMCCSCGQMVCGVCNKSVSATLKCPTCRAPFYVSDEERFKRLWKLVQDRSPGRYTPAAQNNLGFMYNNGQGVKQDYNEAVEWFRKAAAQGLAGAQFNLGAMYSAGRGVKQDFTESVEWYRKAAAQGVAMAQFNLGTMYDNGHGVKQDYTEAVAWFRKAAVQGLAEAQNGLGNMCDAGRGVKQDRKEADEWYRKAAAQGDAQAQYNLGAMYANGQGVPQDFAESLKWWQLAAEQDSKGALKNLDTMQQGNLIPTPPPGSAVTTVLLTTGKAAKLNNTSGTVVAAPSPAMIRPGIAIVLLDGELLPIMFKTMNLRIKALL